jgi:AcrR family transcriptional regulator
MGPVTAHSEREWILIGIAECCATKGYEATTVDDVCAAAGVSRQSFDALFADKGDCLGAATESIFAAAWAAVDTAISPERPWAANLRDGADALLRLLGARPAFAWLALIEAPLAGGRAAALHASGKAALLDFLELGREQAAEPGIPASAARGALAGAEALVVREVLAGRAGELGAQAPAIVYMLTVPFLGVGEAGRLARGAARQRHLRAVA